jgi:hypothetical protein
MRFKPDFAFISRSIIALALTLAVTGCPQNQQQITALPPPPSAKPIPAGETVIAEFAPDGAWHSSGFYARPGDLLRFKATGEAAYAANNALLLHIGRTSAQLVHSEAAQAVTQAGEIYFKVDLRYLGPYPDPTIGIQIANERKKSE